MSVTCQKASNNLNLNGVCVSEIPRPTDFNLVVIIALAALGLLLLLLLLFIVPLIVFIALRRRRRAKASDSSDAQLSSSTVSVNLSPSGSSCSRTSDDFVDIDGDAPPPPPPPAPPVPTVSETTPEPEVTAAPRDDVSESRPVLTVPNKADGIGVGVGVGVSRKSWTAASFSVADLRKVPPTVAKKTARTQAAAHLVQSRRGSVESLDVSVTVSSADPLPGVGPERPRPLGPTGRYVHIPPKLHHEPRGWAPASHAVPAPVKRTWGRAKAKLAAERERELAEGINPSVTTSNLSLTDDENCMGSTMSLNI